MGNWLSQTYPGVAPALTEKNLPNQTGKVRRSQKIMTVAAISNNRRHQMATA